MLCSSLQHGEAKVPMNIGKFGSTVQDTERSVNK